jgi:hypothetical protein
VNFFILLSIWKPGGKPSILLQKYQGSNHNIHHLPGLFSASDLMRIPASTLIAFCIIMLILVAGSAEINVQQKTGIVSDEQNAIDWFKSTYGDPLTNNDQPARFIEPLITTGLDANNLPKNKVTTFPQSGGSVFFFVIYDNFRKGDPVTVSWIYLENGRNVTIVKEPAGGDFGRFLVEFQKPDSGWGRGRQEIVVTGDGASGKVDFTIGDVIQTAPLPYNLPAYAAQDEGGLYNSSTIPAGGTVISRPGPDVPETMSEQQSLNLLTEVSDVLSETLMGIRAVLGI